MTYITPSEMNVTGWSGLLLWANVVTDQWFGAMILLAIFLIMFITLIFTAEPAKAFAVSSFLTAIIALLFRGIGIIGAEPLLIAIVFAAIGFVVIKKGS